MSRRQTWCVPAVAVLATLAGCGSLGTPSGPDAVEPTLTEAIEALPVAAEERSGYDRDLFPHWTDADGDDCNARYEVLIDEAVESPDVGADCRLTGGRWTSYFDGAEWTDTADVDVDHLVPLAEAWDSGAGEWSTDDRERYANDLDDERTLAAVTDNVNQSKGDQDPAEWLPPREQTHCRYLEEWVVVKSRWELSVDEAEKDRLTQLSQDCEDTALSFEPAR